MSSLDIFRGRDITSQYITIWTIQGKWGEVHGQSVDATERVKSQEPVSGNDSSEVLGEKELVTEPTKKILPLRHEVIFTS